MDSAKLALSHRVGISLCEHVPGSSTGRQLAGYQPDFGNLGRADEFNTLWSGVFFGLQRMATGSIIIGALWVAVCTTMIAFLQHDLIAGLLFVMCNCCAVIARYGKNVA